MVSFAHLLHVYHRRQRQIVPANPANTHVKTALDAMRQTVSPHHQDS